MFFICMTESFEEPEEDNNKLIEINLRRIARGNQEAIGEIYELTKTAVYGFLLSILKNTQDAEDVLQDTYVKVYQNAGSYHSQGKPMAWIFTIARNLALMKLRKQSRMTDIPEYEWEQISTAGAEGQSDDKILLQAALSKVSKEESNIVMLHAVGGMKHREIAELLNMPLATILSKYNRAIKKLKRILEEDC